MTTYTFRTTAFSGPLEKLLELVQERKLEISRVSLAEVTNDFLRYLETLKDQKQGTREAEGGANARLLADFIVIASRLLLIKSKSLLPDFELTGEEEEAVRDLERRLTLYRAFRPAMRHVARLAREANWEFSRPYFLAMNRAALPGYFGGEAPFYPPKGMGAEVCAEAFGRLVRELQKLTRDAETIKEKITSIEETIEEVVRRLTKTAETRFSVLARRRSRAEILAVFLALLHLAREQMIRVEQEGHFADIMVRKNKSISE